MVFLFSPPKPILYRYAAINFAYNDDGRRNFAKGDIMLKFSNDDYATPRERIGTRRNLIMDVTHNNDGKYSCDGTRVGGASDFPIPASCHGRASLASVYAPMQSYTGLFDPVTALCNGTLFEELYKPLKGGSFNG